jgi:cyclohexyl-isocyanide hydratase
MTTVSATHVGFLLFPNLTQLDFTGPFEVFARLPGAQLHLAAKSLEPLRSESGLELKPTTTLADCPRLDVLCVPGGRGVNATLDDAAYIEFVRRMAAEARWITSVCSGSLLLGAAGLLRGRRAACHWTSRDMLALFGALPQPDRVVIDGNIVTGGGVTAGIDFALRLIGEIAGERAAQAIQLAIEYDPQPPFDAGSPQRADPDLVQQVLDNASASLRERRAAVEHSAKNAPK